jgi:hypothetical protein
MEKMNDIDKLGKKSRQAAILSGLGGLIVLLALIYSAYQLYILEEKKRLIEQELSEKQKIINLKTEEIKALNDEFSQKQTELERVCQELIKKQSTLDYVSLQLAIEKTDTENIELAKKALTPTEKDLIQSKARVYIHIRKKLQSEKAKKVGDVLEKNGYLVPKTEILVDMGPKETQVRYFRESEQETASEIVSILNEAGIFPAKTSYISGYENSELVKPLQFEIWFNENL